MLNAGNSADTAACASPTPLFRPEALAANQAQWLGNIRIARPLSFSLVTCVAAVMAAALLAYACWGEVTRKVTVHGLLLPIGGLINVAAPLTGAIAEVLVHEGDEVRPGQPLLRIRAERITALGDAAQLTAQTLAARRASLNTERRLTLQNLEQRLEALTSRDLSLRAEERQAQSELETHRLRLQLGHKSLERQQELASSGFVAAALVQQKQEELLDLTLRERNAERNLQALRRDLQAASAERRALQTQAQTTLAQLDRSFAALDQESTEAEGRSGLTVTATQPGRISAVTVGDGQPVQAGQTLLSLIPISPTTSQPVSALDTLQAHLFAPSRTAGFIRPGQLVWLRYAAFPYQKFGMARGEVIAISRSPIAAQDLPAGQAQAILAAAQANEPLYRITVRLSSQSIVTYGNTTQLTTGMGIDADIHQEIRQIWEWLLEPALAVIGGHKNLR